MPSRTFVLNTRFSHYYIRNVLQTVYCERNLISYDVQRRKHADPRQVSKSLFLTSRAQIHIHFKPAHPLSLSNAKNL